MKTSAEVRETLVKTLQLDLVGPGPGHPPENELWENEPPSRWYLTGFLVPTTAPEHLRFDPFSRMVRHPALDRCEPVRQGRRYRQAPAARQELGHEDERTTMHAYAAPGSAKTGALRRGLVVLNGGAPRTERTG